MMINLIRFFLYCAFDSNECCALLCSFHNIDYQLIDDTKFSSSQISLFGNLSFDANSNNKIVNWTINCILPTKGFNGPLLRRTFFLVFLSFLNQTINYWVTKEVHNTDNSFISSIFVSIIFLILLFY